MLGAILKARASIAKFRLAGLGAVMRKDEAEGMASAVMPSVHAARRAITMMGGAPVAGACCGIPILIDRPAGFVQRGTDEDGKAWERRYSVDYGFIEGTAGGDGEGLDVFVGGDDAAPIAYFITQRKADGSFDEFKVMLGFADLASAKACYLDHIPRKFLGDVSEVNVEALKALLGIEPADTEKAMGELAKAILLAGRIEPWAPELIDPTLKRWVRAVAVSKADEGTQTEQQIVTGVVLEPDVVDAQKDTYSAEEIEKTAHLWMSDFRNLSLQHKAFVNDKARPVESWVTRVDQELGGVALKAGTWLLTVKVTDAELWRAIKAGEYTGFSIAGFAKKTPLK